MFNKMLVKAKVKKICFRFPSLFKIIYYFVSLITNFDGREHKKKYGCKNRDKIFYVIRPRTNGIEGLMALLIWTLEKTDYAKRMGYIPVVDMKNYYTQYSDGQSNVWHWFFEENNKFSLDEVYDSQNVILSGYKLKNINSNVIVSKQIFDNSIYRNDICNLFYKYYHVNDEIFELVNKEKEIIPINECIGVFLRGTDYVKLTPFGEPIQPTPFMVIDKAKEFQEKYNGAPIFLVTEDQSIYDEFSKSFPKIYIVSFDSFIKDYKGNDFLSKTDVLDSDKKSLGRRYLAKILLLSKCKYFVGSIAGGSKAAFILKRDEFKDKYIFDLGTYQ